MEPPADQGTSASATPPEHRDAGLVRTFLASPILRAGVVLVAVFVMPLVVIALLDPESNPVGPGLMFMCGGVPALLSLVVGIVDGCLRVGRRVRERRAE